MNNIEIHLNMDGNLITFDEVPLSELPFLDKDGCENAWFNPETGFYIARYTAWELTPSGWELNEKQAQVIPDYVAFSLTPIGSLSNIGTGTSPAKAYIEAIEDSNKE